MTTNPPSLNAASENAPSVPTTHHGKPMNTTTDGSSADSLSPELREEIHLAFPTMHNLTDAECDRFRALPCSFRDMLRYTWEAGYCAAPSPYAVAAFVQRRLAANPQDGGPSPSASPQSAPEGILTLREAREMVRRQADEAEKRRQDAYEADAPPPPTIIGHVHHPDDLAMIAALTRARDEVMKDLAASRDREESMDEACDAMQAERDAALTTATALREAGEEVVAAFVDPLGMSGSYSRRSKAIDGLRAAIKRAALAARPSDDTPEPRHDDA